MKIIPFGLVWSLEGNGDGEEARVEVIGSEASRVIDCSAMLVTCDCCRGTFFMAISVQLMLEDSAVVFCSRCHDKHMFLQGHVRE